MGYKVQHQLVKITNNFIKLSDHGLFIFGNFTEVQLRARIVPVIPQRADINFR